MPRRRTPFLADAFYHIYNRGIDRRPIFHREQNYLYFARLLREKADRHAVQVVAYCLMPNHYHFLLRPWRDGVVSPFLNALLGSYVQALNAQQGRLGPLFQGRFRSIHVDRDEYLGHLARYIHLNPVAAGLVMRPQDWPHSNYTRLVEDGTLIGGIFATARAHHDFVEEPQPFELPASLKLAGSQQPR